VKHAADESGQERRAQRASRDIAPINRCWRRRLRRRRVLSRIHGDSWALSAVNDRHLALKALEMALRRRCPDAGLLHHSDQGSTYTSEDYQREPEKHGITCSMSRKGNCYDNAVMESWFSTVKSELGERFESYGVAKAELFDYIEVFYNQQRMHSSIGYATPAEHERAARVKVAA
jgi:transposase InsO family protein